jgi:hypothetical protein
VAQHFNNAEDTKMPKKFIQTLRALFSGEKRYFIIEQQYGEQKNKKRLSTRVSFGASFLELMI